VVSVVPHSFCANLAMQHERFVGHTALIFLRPETWVRDGPGSCVSSVLLRAVCECTGAHHTGSRGVALGFSACRAASSGLGPAS
jgi:hypothetical protein